MPGTLPDGEPYLTLGWHIISWSDDWLIQPDGENAGERWQWSNSQQRFLLWFYSLSEHEKFLYRRAALRWSKGRGKSPALAALCLIEFVGPVVLDFVGPCGDKGCGVCALADIGLLKPDQLAHGKPHPMPWIQIAATSEKQTVNIMEMVTAMAPKGSPIAVEYGLDPGVEVYHKSSGGRLEIISSSPGSAEGGRPTFVAMDEVQEWTPGNGGVRMSETIRRNLAKTGGRSIEAGNAHASGLGSVAEKTFDAWRAQTEGRRVGGILYDAVEAPDDTSLLDEESLRRGLEIAYADARWVDLDRLIQEINDPSTPTEVARRYYLNQITAADDAWLDQSERADWQAMERPAEVVPDGTDIGLFFDGSRSNDATALIGVVIESGHIFTIGIWERPMGVQGRDWQVPVHQVDAAVDAAFDRWNPVAFFADVREWESFVHVSWPEKHADRLLIEAVPNGKAQAPIAWDMRSHIFDFGLAAEQCHGEIIQHAFTHDGDSRLTRHVYNARRFINSKNQVSISKESPGSPAKIDAAVCMIGARMVRRLVLNSKEWQQKSRKGGGFAVFGPGGKARAHSRSGH